MSSRYKILLVQLFSNGDCLYATTVAKQIKQDYPNCNLTWAIAKFCRSIILNNPYVDNVMEVNAIEKNDVVAFRKFKREVHAMKERGEIDLVFITQNMDTNQALYDGCIRSGILNAYPNPIKVPVQPVLFLSEQEKNVTGHFVNMHELNKYKQVILFEFSPQSGQSKITKQLALSVAERLTLNSELAIILSSATVIQHSNKNIIDGSALTLRETAWLTHHCTFLIGCSSGITWISTSGAAKQLPMIQVLNPDTTWINPVSRDFERFGLDTSNLIELTDVDEQKLVSCIEKALVNFKIAKIECNQQIRLQFKTSRKIVYNLFCYLEFGSIVKHIKLNRKIYGDRFDFYKEIAIGLLTSPFKLLRNFIRKRIFKKSI